VEQELELFLSREGRYAADWVPLERVGLEEEIEGGLASLDPLKREVLRKQESSAGKRPKGVSLNEIASPEALAGSEKE
jgi:hypothetical protein